MRDAGGVPYEEHGGGRRGGQNTRIVARAGAEDGHGPPRVAGLSRILPSSSRRASSNATTGVNDSRTTSRSIPARPAYSRAARSIPLTTASRVAWSAARESSQPRTREGMALTPLGSTAILPKVARAPVSSASRRAASTVSAYVSIGSRRSARRVVPAWLASPRKSNRQRPCGQMAEAMPTGSPVRSRARPCSTWSSTNAPIRASRSGSGPMVPGSYPAPSMAAGRVIPAPSRSRWASATASCPAASRDPTQARPKRAPSSSPKLVIASGRVNSTPLRWSSSSAAKEDTTPSGPSKAPPSGTESRWDPVTTASPARGSPSQAHWLPLRSVSYARPRASACARNQARQSRSAG